MRVLIVDDDYNKTADIVYAIENFFPEIDTVETRNDCLRKIFIDKIKYDLVILDMRFPITQGSPIEKECGISVLKEMVRKNFTSPVVFCSSGPVVDWHQYDPNDIVKSFILYDSAISLQERFNGLFIHLFPKKERIKILIDKIKKDCEEKHDELINNLNVSLSSIDPDDNETLKRVTRCCKNVVALDSLERLINTKDIFNSESNKTDITISTSDIIINYLLTVDNIAKIIVDENHIITEERDFVLNVTIHRLSAMQNKKDEGEIV